MSLIYICNTQEDQFPFLNVTYNAYALCKDNLLSMVNQITLEDYN